MDLVFRVPIIVMRETEIVMGTALQRPFKLKSQRGERLMKLGSILSKDERKATVCCLTDEAA